MPTLRKNSWYAITAFLLPVVFFFPKIFFNIPFAQADYLTQYYLWQSYGAYSIYHLRWPWWNPHLFSGTPYFANSQTSMLFPLNWITLPFAQNTLLPFWIYQLETAISTGFGSMGIYLLLTELELLPSHALIGAALWCTSSFFTAYLIDTTNGFYIAQLLPLALWCVVKYARTNKLFWRNSISLLICLAWFAGIPSVFLPFVATIILFWFTVGNKSKNVRSKLHSLMLTLLSGIGLTAVHLVPAIYLLAQAERSTRVFRSASPTLTPWSFLIGLVTSNGSSIHWSIGIIGFILCIFGCWRLIRQPSLRWLFKLFFILLAVAFCVYRIAPLLTNFAPVYNLLRYPMRWFLLPVLGLVIVAALGVQALCETNTKKRVYFFVLSLVGCVATTLFEKSSTVLYSTFGVVLLYCLVTTHSEKQRRYFLTGLLVCIYGSGLQPFSLLGGRLDMRLLQATRNWPIVSHTYSTNGYDSTMSSTYGRFYRSITAQQNLSPVQEEDLAWLPTKIMTVAEDTYFNHVVSGYTSLSETSYAQTSSENAWPTGNGRIVALSHNHPNDFHYRVSAASAATLVLRQNSLPGWSATVNGQRVRIRSINLFMQSIQVPPGDSDVLFSYRPPGFMLGLGFTMFTCISMFVFQRKKTKLMHKA